jgi:hypothetical protein
VYAHLQPCINIGLEESKFWDMTVAELIRYEEGAHWRMKQRAQFDYTLANLIGVSSARMMSKDVVFPSVEEVYPTLFSKSQAEKDAEEKQRQEEELATQNSVNRFMEFALKHNSMMRREEGDKT